MIGGLEALTFANAEKESALEDKIICKCRADTMIISDPPFEGKNHLRMISVIWHPKEIRLQMFCKSTNLPLTFRLHAKNERRQMPSFLVCDEFAWN